MVSSACGFIRVFIIYWRKVYVWCGCIGEKGIRLPVVGYIYFREREKKHQRCELIYTYGFLVKMETATVATVGGKIKCEEGVAFTKFIARQLVPFVVCLFTSGGKQVDVASNVAAGLEVWLERFRRNLPSVDLDCQEVNGVVLGVEGVLEYSPL